METHNVVPKRVRDSLIGLLQSLLASAIDLERQAKQAHWNVKGPNFYSLHLLFDELHSASDAWGDLIGERIMQLGGHTHGTVQAVAQHTMLPELPTTFTEERSLVEHLSRSLANFTEAARSLLARSEEEGDPITADIMTDVTRQAEKLLWFIESHLD